MADRNFAELSRLITGKRFSLHVNRPGGYTLLDMASLPGTILKRDGAGFDARFECYEHGNNFRFEIPGKLLARLSIRNEQLVSTQDEHMSILITIHPAS